jgi:hypothetical protein
MRMAAAPFFFQILLGGLKGVPSTVAHRSIIVEVSPRMMSGANLVGEKEKTEREFAEETARRVATEVIENEFGSKSEPSGSIAQIGSLSDEIELQPPTLQRTGVRAWLL